MADRLDFALMAALEARRDRLSLLGDLQYLNIAEGRNAAVAPVSPHRQMPGSKGRCLPAPLATT